MIKSKVLKAAALAILLTGSAAGQTEKTAAEIVDSLFMRAASGSVMFSDQVEPSKQALIEMGTEAIPRMLTKLNTRSAREMHAIVDIFKGIGEVAVKSLAGKLKARDDYVRRLAIRCLGEIKSPKAIESLLTLTDHADFRTRSGVMTALGQIGDERGAIHVIKGLSDPDELVATSAAVACGRIKKGIDPNALIEALNHPYYGVRYSVMNSLVELGDASIAPMIHYIDNRPEDLGAGYAIEALGRLGSKDALKALGRTINSDDWSIRAFSAEALGELRQKKAEKLIKNALKIETHPLVKNKLKKSLVIYESHE